MAIFVPSADFNAITWKPPSLSSFTSVLRSCANDSVASHLGRGDLELMQQLAFFDVVDRGGLTLPRPHNEITVEEKLGLNVA